MILELKYKMTEQTNSGIFILTPDRKNPACTGMEIQVTDSYGRAGLSNKSTAGQKPDETANKFKDAAIKDFSRVGYIGLHDHGRPVWY